MVSLREAVFEDESFLLDLYRDVREAEVSSWGLATEEALSLLQMQYYIQKRSYSLQYPNATTFVIVVHQTDIGRIILDRTSERCRIIDISISSLFRNQGAGMRTLASLQQQCMTEGGVISLRVMKSNPAIRLYARLGFRVVQETEIDMEMVWKSKELQQLKEDLYDV